MVVGTKNIQAEAEAWNRNVDLLNLITMGQALFYKGMFDRDVKHMYDGLMCILMTVAPMMKQEIDIEEVRPDGTKQKTSRTYVGLNTRIYKIYMNNMMVAERHMVASLNSNYDRQTRFGAAAEAYRILLATGFQLFQEIDAMGFNIKMKTPGYAAGIQGG